MCTYCLMADLAPTASDCVLRGSDTRDNAVALVTHAAQASLAAATDETGRQTALTRGIDWGSELNDPVIRVYFAPSGFRGDGITSEGWNAYEKAQFELAFEQIEAVVNVDFIVVSQPRNADFTLINDRDEINDLGYFNPPGERGAGIGVFGGDDWDRGPNGDLEQGGFGYVTIVHELLHGMGMAHPHDRGGSSTIFSGVSRAFDDTGRYDLNQGVYTTMSYNSGYISGPAGTAPPRNGNWGHEAGPMALDIAVLQDKYGANMDHNTGANIYDLPGANARGTSWKSIWDADGVDEIRYSGTRDTTIDLRDATLNSEEGGGGFISGAKGIAGGYTIAADVVIENARSGAGDDDLIGNEADNRLIGNDGDDTLEGAQGNDTLQGGNDDDSLTGSVGDDSLQGGNGDDTLDAGSGNDTARGGSGDDSVDGGTGNDSLIGDSGSDTVLAGAGNDTVRSGTGDDLVAGGDGDDRLLGGGQDDRLNGQDNDDTLNGGSGNDTLNGGDGDDRINASGDDDVLLGGDGNDVLRGGNGDDEIEGNRGDDRLLSDAGNDTLDGGSGADVFSFKRGMDNDTISDFNTRQDSLRIDDALVGGQSAAQLVAAADVSNAGVTFDFGNGDTLFLDGVSNNQALIDAIDIA